MTTVHVALVPGFFGFANLGDLAYFGHVHAFLLEAYRARGFEPVLHVVKTHPTASVVGEQRASSRRSPPTPPTMHPSTSSAIRVADSTAGCCSCPASSFRVPTPSSRSPRA
jgi:hypothetical protein